MDVANWCELVRKVSRSEFVRIAPMHFLLVFQVDRTTGSRISFRTTTDPTTHEPPPLPTSRSTYDIRAIVKAPGNPYPDRISVGRALNCDIALRDATVSKLHAHILGADPLALQLVDLGAANGTYVNSSALVPNEPRALVRGDVLQFGSVLCELADAGEAYDVYDAYAPRSVRTGP